jgi:tetratricopeptide (TPR) repeat protein
MAKHTMARVLADQGRFANAVDRYREAAHLYGSCGETFEAIKVRIGIGTCYVDLGKTREGVRMLRSALADAKSEGHRRLQAFAWSNLSQAYYRQNDIERARGCLRESDSLALYNNEKQSDILFLNAYYEWKIAGSADNPTRERIAFGRLKALRSELERKFPEVEAFDSYMERGCRHA